MSEESVASGDPFSERLMHWTLLDMLTQASDAKIPEEYAANPDLYAFAEEQGRMRAQELLAWRGEPRDGPVPDDLLKAYTKLLFVFTDPQDFERTLSTTMLAEITMLCTGNDPAGSPLELLAIPINNLASHAHLIRRTYERQELFPRDASEDEKLLFCLERLSAAIGENDDSGAGDEPGIDS